MASGYKNAAGTDFDGLFDPDVIGDGPTATNFKNADGSLLKYAAAKYGTVGPNVNYKQANNTDLATLWSKKGTAKYTLPINGQTFTADDISPNPCTSRITLTLNTDGTYAITRLQQNSAPSTVTLATGTWNTSGGSSSGYQALYTLTTLINTGSGYNSSGNDASSYTTISSNLSAYANSTSPTPATGTHELEMTLRIQIKQIASGVVISDTTITIDAISDPSGS